MSHNLPSKRPAKSRDDWSHKRKKHEAEEQAADEIWVEKSQSEPLARSASSSAPAPSESSTSAAKVRPEASRRSLQDDKTANQDREAETLVTAPKAGTLQDAAQSELDYFSSLGARPRKRAQGLERPKEQEALHAGIVRLGAVPDSSDVQRKEHSDVNVVVGGPGSKWRMMKLRRTYEIAEHESRPVREVALERYGSMEAWEDALRERHALDNQQEPPLRSAGASSSSVRSARLLGSSELGRESFRKPLSDYAPSPQGTPGPISRASAGTPMRQDSASATGPSLASRAGTPLPKASTGARSHPASADTDRAGLVATLSGASGDPNKRRATELRAQLADATNHDNVPQSKVRHDDEEPPRFPGEQGAIFEALPTLDGRGRLYDLGTGLGAEDVDDKATHRRKTREPKFQTHDPKTGELLRLNPDDDIVTVGAMVRDERLRGGLPAEKNPDAEIAAHIISDRRFEDDFDYVDDNAERFARKKAKTAAAKRMFALNDYAKTKKALDSCLLCPQDRGAGPRAAVIASGVCVYLACPLTDGLVQGHCIIVPMQHYLSTLEGDDDLWDEIKNFMKCLMQMFAARDQGVIFYETVFSLNQQRHTYIEAVPLPWSLWEDVPAFFRESILAAGSEWTQNRKLIDFSKRPGGFRRSLVPSLPYFMVQWDYRGERGFGHVIEDEADQGDDMDPGAAMEEGAKGGPMHRTFAAELIASILNLEPRKWRRPRRLSRQEEEERLHWFHKTFAPFDWTKQLPGASS